MRRLIVVPLLALAGCTLGGGSSPTDITVEIPRREMSDADIEVLAVELAWAPEEVCPAYRELLARGLDRDSIDRMALVAAEDGYGERFQPATERRFLELLHEC